MLKGYTDVLWLSLALMALLPTSEAFLQPRPAITTAYRLKQHLSFAGGPLYSSSSETQIPESNVEPPESQASKWRAEAVRIRLEAEKMDALLTLNKIETIEGKLGSQSWLDKHPAERDGLQQQLEALQKKLVGEEPVAVVPAAKVDTDVPELVETLGDKERVDESVLRSVPTVKPLETPAANTSDDWKPTKASSIGDPLSGFDDSDLVLYIPVAQEIEARLGKNSTTDEKLEAFQTAPELQEHFKKKIQAMLVEPMEDMQRLEDIKQKYLFSSSSVEKERLKREIDRLELTLEEEGPFTYSDSIYKEIPPLADEEISKRLDAVGKLPLVLQTLYKKRTGVKSDGDIRLAIELDHYEAQIQLLEQIRYVVPLDDEMRAQAVQSLDALPASVRDHVAKGLGLENGSDIEAIIKELCGGENDDWGPLQQVLQTASNTPDLPEYNDIDFVDRSRYMDEFYPSISRLEDVHPGLHDVEAFMAEVLDRKTYMVSSKPERVVGGYYIRGENVVSDDETGVKMVTRLQEKLAASSIGEKLDFFYIPDPAPPTDEEVDTGYGHQPLLLVTMKDPAVLYDGARPLTKAAISALGICSTLIYALGTCELQPAIQDRLNEALAAGDTDVSWLTNIAITVALSSGAIQLSHEAAHRVFAWKDKFEIGLPTPVPSIQLGLLGGITPLKSPPPTLKSLFDFALAGPLVGLIVSLAFLVSGLSITASMDMEAAAQLPCMPIFLLQSSALGSGLIEFFLGNGVLVSGVTENAVLPLHPFAIAGFTGMLANALALLPLGQTDGGRIALAMFGRRGTYLVNTFTAVFLCGLGLVGLDESRILITYVLYTAVWQRELETPARNEVDELDFLRGVLGIFTALLVALALVPMF